MSRSKVSRLERDRAPDASVRTLVLLFALLGHTLAVRAFPQGSPVRDAGHIRLLKRLLALLPASIRVRLEVPLRRIGDLRAWDAELRGDDRACMVEAETVLADLQALDRRIALKMKDDDVTVVILLVADTRRNREALRAGEDLLGSRFPLATKEVLRELRAGRVPERSGIALL